ncbi:phosphotransferase [Pseudonocardia sp.]|uniref:phosphotransferase n=1 Tax=Pseudonocardia sp. TaxID=60912 RepID=UPI003D0D06B2
MIPVIPAVVRALADAHPVREVWVNEIGGRTYSVGDRYVKWTPPDAVGRGLDVAGEVARLEWAWAFTPVPRVLDHGSDDRGSWLVTAALPGESAIADRWLAEPATAVAAIGSGLRAMHDALPVAECPFTWSAAERIAAAVPDPSRWHADHAGLTAAEALRRIAEPPPVDRLVVCHGDACAPNTLLHDDGRWLAHVDLDCLGVADRWADIAVATWSTEWNYGPSWTGALLDAYGVAPDPERTTYYRLLWDLGP